MWVRVDNATKSIFAAALLMIVAKPAWSVDGLIEVNQSSAIAGDVTAGDAPGFPVTLTEPGSYILTTDLTLPNADTTGIQLEADNITVNLNGFSIIGVNTCTSTLPPVCTTTRVGVGIRKGSTTTRQVGIAILNGTITGMGSSGTLFGGGARPPREGIVGDEGEGFHRVVTAAAIGRVLEAGHREEEARHFGRRLRPGRAGHGEDGLEVRLPAVPVVARVETGAANIHVDPEEETESRHRVARAPELPAQAVPQVLLAHQAPEGGFGIGVRHHAPGADLHPVGQANADGAPARSVGLDQDPLDRRPQPDLAPAARRQRSMARGMACPPPRG